MTTATKSPVTVDVDDCVHYVTLNRPDKRNSLNVDIVEALIAAVTGALSSGARLLVFRGEGKSFSAGFDFTDIADQTDAVLAHRFLRIETLLQAVASARTTTIALAHGPIFGAGADLFTACDERILAPGSTLRFPGLRFDVVLGTRRLVDRVGIECARSALAEGRTITADEAHSTNLATQIVPDENWPHIIDRAIRRASLLSTDASFALGRALTVGSPDKDFAALARSVAKPRLQERIQEYLKGTRK